MNIQKSVKQVNIDYKKTRLKICNQCGKECAVAKKLCSCGFKFELKKKTLLDRIPSGKTNVTEEKSKIHARMYGLNIKHGYSAMVFYFKKSKVSCHDFYATPGFAEDFVGNKGTPTDQGATIMQAIKLAFEDYSGRQSAQVGERVDEENEIHGVEVNHNVPGEVAERIDEENEIHGVEVNHNVPGEVAERVDEENEIHGVEVNHNVPGEIAERIDEENEVHGVEVNHDVPGEIAEIIDEENEIHGVEVNHDVPGEIAVKSCKEIRAGNVIAIYTPDDDPEPFWLFRMKFKSRDCVNGAWLNLQKDNTYKNGSKDKVNFISIIRPSIAQGIIYVLPNIYLGSKVIYHLKTEVYEFLKKKSVYK